MKLNRSRKIYLGIMFTAIGAFAWDQCSQPPPAAGDTSTVLLKAAGKSGMSVQVSLANGSAGVLAGASLDLRILAIAQEQGLDVMAMKNPFVIPRTWSGLGKPEVDKTPKVSVHQADIDLIRKKIQEFKKEHVSSVVVGNRGYVCLNGKGIFIGEKYDGFMLIAVEKDRAKFEINGVQVAIPLVEEFKVQRQGTVIENLSTTGPRDKMVSPSK